MTEQINKVYNFKRIELAVLFALKGVRELFGFHMDVSGEVDKYLVNKTLFELSRKEIIFLQDKNVKIQAEIDSLLGDIIGAKHIYFFAERTAEKPEGCIYIGKRAVSVHMVGYSGDIVRMEGFARNDVPDRLLQMGFQLEYLVGDHTLFCENPRTDNEIAEMAGKQFLKEKDSLWKQAEIVACLIRMSTLTRQKEEQILLLSKGIEDLITVSNGSTNVVYAYSERKLLQLIDGWIEGGDR